MISGIINVDKISGFSSFWHDKFIKNLTGSAKVGHTGTLDPNATGLLTICLGKATRLINYLSGEKTYIAEAFWGVQTDTDDITGIPLFYSEKQVKQDVLEDVMKDFTGKIFQTPPIYSAIKINGKRLYDYARKNEKVAVNSREVNIYEIALLEHHKNRSRLKIHCSKGTYIRALIRDIGKQLGCYGTLLSLRRIASDHFDITDAFTISRIYDKLKNNDIKDVLMPMSEAVSFMRSMTVKKQQESDIKNGRLVSSGVLSGTVAILNNRGELIAIGRGTRNGIKPETVLI